LALLHQKFAGAIGSKISSYAPYGSSDGIGAGPRAFFIETSQFFLLQHEKSMKCNIQQLVTATSE
jgi:hypothetical protein